MLVHNLPFYSVVFASPKMLFVEITICRATVMTEGKRQIIQQLLQEYDIETAEDIQDALKDLLGGTIKDRNGYKEKTVNSSYGSMRIEVPQDRKSTFEPKVVTDEST